MKACCAEFEAATRRAAGGAATACPRDRALEIGPKTTTHDMMRRANDDALPTQMASFDGRGALAGAARRKLYQKSVAMIFAAGTSRETGGGGALWNSSHSGCRCRRPTMGSRRIATRITYAPATMRMACSARSAAMPI